VVIAQAFLALLAGFATMALLVIIVTALLTRLAPQWVGQQTSPRPGYVVVNLGYSLIAAAAGGYVTAWAGAENPLRDVLGLAVVVLALGGISALQARGRQPLWYQATLIAMTPLSVVAGGLLRLRVLGLL
jgi:hypothetical protein